MEIIKHDRLKNARSSSPHNFYNENASPLQTAISFSQLSQAKVLLSFYPELINCRNSNGSTIIHTAVLEGDAEALEFLLRHASARLIRAVDDFGCTALHLAPDSKIIKMLMETNLFTGKECNYSGITPITLFRKLKLSQDILQLFNAI